MSNVDTPAVVGLSEKLGPLPEPVDELAMEDGFNVIGVAPVFTAKQMREYAAQQVAAERERCAKLCERIASRDGLEWPGKPRTYFCDDGTGCAAAIRMDGA